MENSVPRSRSITGVVRGALDREFVRRFSRYGPDTFFRPFRRAFFDHARLPSTDWTSRRAVSTLCPSFDGAVAAAANDLPCWLCDAKVRYHFVGEIDLEMRKGFVFHTVIRVARGVFYSGVTFHTEGRCPAFCDSSNHTHKKSHIVEPYNFAAGTISNPA